MSDTLTEYQLSRQLERREDYYERELDRLRNGMCGWALLAGQKSAEAERTLAALVDLEEAVFNLPDEVVRRFGPEDDIAVARRAARRIIENAEPKL